MKLAGYEWYKLWKKKIVWIAGILLLGVNIGYFYYQQYDKNALLLSYQQEYKEMLGNYQSLSLEAGMEKATEQKKLLELYNILSKEVFFAGSGILEQLLEENKLSSEAARELYEHSIYFEQVQDIERDFYLTSLISGQYEKIEQFRHDMLTMKERAESMLAVSIFYEKDSFSYRNIVKTVKDFSGLEHLPLSVGEEEGFKALASTSITDISVIILMFLYAFILFQTEKEEGMIPLLRSTRHGRWHIAVAKLIVFGIMALGTASIFYGAQIVAAHYIYGFDSLARYVQSMPLFSRTTWVMTAGQFLILFFVLKLAAQLVLAWGIAVIFLLFRQISLVYIAGAILGAGSYLLYTLIHPNSYINLLKYSNFAAVLDSFQLLTDYRNVNLFGLPLGKELFLAIIAIMLFIGLPLAAIRLYLTDTAVSIRSSRVLYKLRRFLFQHRRSNSLTQHELFKLFISGKVWAVLGIAFIVAWQQVEVKDWKLNRKEEVYNKYIEQIAGTLTEQKLQFIEQERDRFSAIPNEMAKLDELLESGEIDLLQFRQETGALEFFANKQEIFVYVEKQRDYLVNLQQQTGITGSFINEISSDALFDRQKQAVRDSMIYTLLLLAGISPLLAKDFRNGMNPLIISTLKGRMYLFAVKYGLAYAYALGIFLILNFPLYYNVLRHYPAMDWHAPVQSVKALAHIDWQISLLQFTVVTELLKLIGIWLMLHTVMLIAVYVKKQAFILFGGSALLLFPLSVQVISGQLWMYSYSPVFQLFYPLGGNSYSMTVLIYYLILIIVALATTAIAHRRRITVLQ